MPLYYGLLPVAPPRSRKIALLGDSRCARAYQLGGTSYSLDWENFAMWGQQEAGGWRCWVDADGAFGYSGERTDQILARADTWMPWARATGGTFIFMMGRNDNQGAAITREATVANLFTMRDMLLSAGCRVIMTTDTPQGDSTFTAATLANPERHMWMREEILKRAGEAPGRFFVVDTWEGITDEAATNGNAIAGNLVDGTHNSVTGARRLGLRLVPTIQAIYPDPVSILPVNSETYDATLNPSAPLNSNPMLTGTTGTLAGGTTGQVATGWTLTAGVGATVAGSKVTDADGTTWQRITISGTASGTGTAASFTNPNVSSGFYTLSDRFYVACEWRVPSGSVTNIGMIAPAARGQIDGANVNAYAGRIGTSVMPDVAYARRTAVTPVTQVANSTQTAVSARFDINAFTSGTVGAIVDVRAIALRKV